MLQTDSVFNMMRLDISFFNEHITELFSVEGLFEESCIKLLTRNVAGRDQDFTEPEGTGDGLRRLLVVLKIEQPVQLLFGEHSLAD